jgi:hypothetical protein
MLNVAPAPLTPEAVADSPGGPIAVRHVKGKLRPL